MNTESLAEIVVLQRMDGAAAATGEEAYARLRAAITGQTVSTGDCFAGFEIIEIVPPDEPAHVAATTTLEIV
ncbi:MAG TPA: hypothetical protein VFU78_15185 [Thermomicrobiales bacterium]|nr:hypothetical protein [Thermomicrobiales bacterium]